MSTNVAFAIDLNTDGKIAHVYVVLATRKLTSLAAAFERITSLEQNTTVAGSCIE